MGAGALSKATIWSRWIPARAIGCVVDPACEVVAPGVIEHHAFTRFTLGEPDGSLSPRVQALSNQLMHAGFDAPIRDNIRWNIWLKLWGNACFNPISLLTGATLDRITGEPGLRNICTAVMQECRLVATVLRIEIPEAMIQRRLDVAGSAVGHKMSMLQDLESGRSIELDALVTAVHELGALTHVATPAVDMLLSPGARARPAGWGLRLSRSTVVAVFAHDLQFVDATLDVRKLPYDEAQHVFDVTVVEDKPLQVHDAIGYRNGDVFAVENGSSCTAVRTSLLSSSSGTESGYRLPCTTMVWRGSTAGVGSSCADTGAAEQLSTASTNAANTPAYAARLMNRGIIYRLS